jgi:hypothetical protein
VAYGKYQQGGDDIAGGIEGLVAAELTIEGALADQPRRDSRERVRGRPAYLR